MPADLRVLVATPLGQGGNGGIDRLMDSVRAELVARPRPGVAVRFAPTRGQGSILLAPLVLAGFLLRLAATRPDVVHINLASHGSTYRKLVVAGLARTLGVRTVIHLHGAWYRRFWGDAKPWLDRRIARMFGRAARVVVLGRVWRDFIAGRVPEARIVVLPNAAPQPVLAHVPSSEVRLLFLGRFGARKGAFDLVDALARLAGLPGWSATLAGDGEVAAVRDRIAASGLAGRVTVPGWVGPGQVAGLVAASDVLVLPSYDENLPMSVIEGMAAGLAIVATPVGAVEDIVTDGETGLLVQPGDVEGLAAALRRVVEDAPLRARLGAAGQAVHRARLDIAPYVDALIAIWREAAA